MFQNASPNIYESKYKTALTLVASWVVPPVTGLARTAERIDSSWDARQAVVHRAVVVVAGMPLYTQRDVSIFRSKYIKLTFGYLPEFLVLRRWETSTETPNSPRSVLTMRPYILCNTAALLGPHDGAHIEMVVLVQCRR